MPTFKIDDDKLVSKISEVFRKLGYEGASMTALTEATGLQRASLYHRFPDGKQAMANIVIQQASQNLKRQLSALNKNTSLNHEEKLKTFKCILSDFYCQGHLPCVIDSMSYDLNNYTHAAILKESISALIDELRIIAMDAGLTIQESSDWSIIH
ncbi:MAG: TetR/AcrR family transcriptional regulator [Verrucomicrobiota bacterium]